jgi:hypothetical protein
MSSKNKDNFETILGRAKETILTKVQMSDHFGYDRSSVSLGVIEKLTDYLSHSDRVKAIDFCIPLKLSDEDRDKVLTIMGKYK